MATPNLNQSVPAVVAMAQCADYAPDRVRAAVRHVLDIALDNANTTWAGKRVLLKPNLLSSNDPPERAVNTHPVVVHAAAEYFAEQGAHVFIGDSCGSLAPGSTAQAFRMTGLDQVAQAVGAQLVDFDRASNETRKVPNPRLLHEVTLPCMLRDIDLFVTVPKFKTHGLTLLTGAIKNQLGLVPGRGKKDVHLKAPKPAALAQAMVDIHSVVRPGLALMDAVVGMEGNGPAAGTPREVGWILAATDCVALDAVAGSMMDYAEGEVCTTAFAEAQGFGVGRRTAIHLAGASFDDIRMPDFKKPPRNLSSLLFAILPNALIRWLIDHLGTSYPTILNDRCIACGACVTNCPAGALTKNNDLVRVNRKRCIGCYCCSEICPERAVVMRRPLIARVVRKITHWVMRRS